MNAVRHLALGICVLCAVGGILQIFWPENGYKPVINTVLVLYIITSVLQMRGSKGQLPQLQWDSLPENANLADYQDYANELALESSVEALDRLLDEAGIPASVWWEDGRCKVQLKSVDDTDRAREILEANCGELTCEILPGGDAP